MFSLFHRKMTDEKGTLSIERTLLLMTEIYELASNNKKIAERTSPGYTFDPCIHVETHGVVKERHGYQGNIEEYREVLDRSKVPYENIFSQYGSSETIYIKVDLDTLAKLFDAFIEKLNANKVIGPYPERASAR